VWYIVLRCDGCDETLRPLDPSEESHPDLAGIPGPDEVRARASEQLPEGLPERLRAYLAEVRACRISTRIVASWRRWECVVSPDDGEQWFCPTCRLARDREALVPDVGLEPEDLFDPGED
jgi:hypothetical protein